MNESIMRGAGFGASVDLVKAGKCPFCKQIVDKTKFRDKVSLREFEISGLCQTCQDETFGIK